MRLIDADALKKKAFRYAIHGELLPETVYAGDIDKAPTVDAVPVVRCENCVCYRELDDDHAYCTNHLPETEADDYCSYGIRKDWEHGAD